MLPCLSYVYWEKYNQSTNGVNGYGQNPIAAFILKIQFNQIFDTKFGPVKVRALETPKHVTVHMPPHPMQAQPRKPIQLKVVTSMD